MLLRGAERPNGGFSCFRATRKDQMENFRASAWRRKAKWKIFMFPRGAERPNGGFSCFRVARKDQKRGFRCYSAARKDQKENFRCYSATRKDQMEVLGVTARRGKT